MADEPATVGEAVAVAADAARAAADVARSEADERVEEVIERAAEEINQAHEQTEALARAAMETELGRRLGELEREFTEWRVVALAELQSQVTTLQETVNTLQGQMSATATLATAAASPPSIPQQSAQQPTKVEEAIQEVTEILPETLTPENSDQSASTNDAPPVRRKRFL